MNGFINVLKPPNMSSGAVVAYIKKLTGQRIGHAGTLDPQASGILPVMIGQATRLFDYLVDKRKTYIAEIAFGTSTDTQDAQGAVVEYCSHKIPESDTLSKAFVSFCGHIKQCPPAYSAIKQKGIPLYSLARKGYLVETEPRDITVYSIELIRPMKHNSFLLKIVCGKGVYIRTLCHDIGRLLECPAHMRFLLRTQTGCFDLSTAVLLEELAETNDVARFILPLDYPLKHLRRLDIPNEYEKACRNGVKLPVSIFSDIEDINKGDLVRFYHEDRFTGIAQLCESGLLAYRAMILQTDHHIERKSD